MVLQDNVDHENRLLVSTNVCIGVECALYVVLNIVHDAHRAGGTAVIYTTILVQKVKMISLDFYH